MTPLSTWVRTLNEKLCEVLGRKLNTPVLSFDWQENPCRHHQKSSWHWNKEVPPKCMSNFKQWQLPTVLKPSHFEHPSLTVWAMLWVYILPCWIAFLLHLSLMFRSNTKWPERRCRVSWSGKSRCCDNFYKSCPDWKSNDRKPMITQLKKFKGILLNKTDPHCLLHIGKKNSVWISSLAQLQALQNVYKARLTIISDVWLDRYAVRGVCLVFCCIFFFF